jgi:hypothetical protein
MFNLLTTIREETVYRKIHHLHGILQKPHLLPVWRVLGKDKVTFSSSF